MKKLADSESERSGSRKLQSTLLFRALINGIDRRMPKLKNIVLTVTLLASSTAVTANSLSIGPFDQGIYSGTPPFNVTGTCTDPGDDCNDTDNRVRTADLIQYAWSIAASGIPSGNPDFVSVILEQTIQPGIGADVQIDNIPTICLAPPAGPGGSNPLSSLTLTLTNRSH